MGSALVRVGTLDFEVWQDGPAGGPAVLLLHGFPQDHQTWRSWVPALAAAGYRVIRPLQRGYGSSCRPADDRSYRMDAIVADAFGILDGLGIDASHVVGHDWGGAVAWEMAAAEPQRLISLTVLSTPHPAALRAAAARSTQGIRSWYMALFQSPGLAERLAGPDGPLWPRLMRGLPHEDRVRYERRAREPGAFAAMTAWYRGMARDLLPTIGDAGRRPARIPHASIVVPTMYAWGMRDPALGRAAAHATASFVNAPMQFWELPRHGHWLAERASQMLVPLLLAHLRSAHRAG
ncbi:MAG: alpha/beta fold hydrolase [Actinomycetales bacterium]|nr:alpha/beta fold hydrolase [Actinomycetales bacterium]